jgi:hypothetical protein
VFVVFDSDMTVLVGKACHDIVAGAKVGLFLLYMMRCFPKKIVII